MDLNYLGIYGGALAADITGALHWMLGPLYFAKLYVPLVIFFVGLSAWFFFRSAKFSLWACALGGLAAALNSTYFSVACWGVGTHALAAGFSFLAMGLAANPESRGCWARYILAGFAIGLGVAEGADVGGFFSMFVAAVVFYQTWITVEGPTAKKIALGAGRVALIAVCALLISAHTVSALFHQEIKGIAGAQQDTATKQRQWDFATQWSLHKRETLSIFIPGLYGFRMTPPPADGSDYWGPSGRDLIWDQYFGGGKQGARPEANLRFSGGGNYAGVLVLVVGLWAALQSFRKSNSVFTLVQRKSLWFWLFVAIISLLIAWGRFAPFYQFVYAVPYFSAVRNPGKFVHTFTLAIVVIFGYGIHGLTRNYMELAAGNVRIGTSRFKSWWVKASAFDRRWVIGSLLAFVACLVGWLIYSFCRSALERYLMEVPLQSIPFDENMARTIAGYSISQVGVFVLFLALSFVTVVLTLSGYFAGARANWGGFLLGAILVTDLALVDQHWIFYWNKDQKYATNPVIDLLREKPYEHRVALLPFSFPPQFSLLKDLYRIEWTQHLFLYYNIQSLEVIQEPRVSSDKLAYEAALLCGATAKASPMLRRWQLTNTRYLLGPAGYLSPLNQELDPLHRFRILAQFKPLPKPGIANPTRLEEISVEIAPDGQFALFDFTGALPRAKLYSNWQVSTNDPTALQQWMKTVRECLQNYDAGKQMVEALANLNATDQATLKELASDSFVPEQTVLLSSPLPGSTPNPANATNQNPGKVDFESYAPKEIHLHANANVDSVLLLNDKYDPNWKVYVDKKPAPLLRCNFIMQGVQVPQGDHVVEFRLEVSRRPLYVSLGAIGIGLLLIGYLYLGARRKESSGPEVQVKNPAAPNSNRQQQLLDFLQPRPWRPSSSGAGTCRRA